jgi:hypothetical protein
LRLAQLLLAEGRWEDAQAAFKELGTRNAHSRIWEEAGTSLVRAERYELAIEFLKHAAADRPSAQVELAVALYFTAGAEEPLKVLEQVPDAERAGDFRLLKARLLDACGRKAEAEQVLQAGLRLPAARPHVAQQAALLLLSHDQPGDAFFGRFGTRACGTGKRPLLCSQFQKLSIPSGVLSGTRGILAWCSRATGHLQPIPGADEPRYVHTKAGNWPDMQTIQTKPRFSTTSTGFLLTRAEGESRYRLPERRGTA